MIQIYQLLKIVICKSEYELKKFLSLIIIYTIFKGVFFFFKFLEVTFLDSPMDFDTKADFNPLTLQFDFTIKFFD